MKTCGGACGVEGDLFVSRDGEPKMSVAAQTRSPRARQQPPGPRGTLIWGNLAEFRADRLRFLERCAQDFGDVVKVRLGPVRIWLLNHPDLVEEVLVAKNRSFHKHFALRQAKPSLGEGLLTSEGDFWRRQRKLAQPAFHRERVASYASIMVDYTKDMLGSWKSEETRDVQEEMMRLTLLIVAKCLFDADVAGDSAGASNAMEVLTRSFTDRVNQVVRLPMWIPTPSNVRYKGAMTRLESILLRIIGERRASKEDRGDLLSMLLAAADDETGARMSDRQLRDEAMTLFLAGHETTANTLSWAWFALSSRPDVEAKLHEEIDRVLCGRTPRFEDLPNLKYCEWVIHETLRLFPTVWLLGREAIEPIEIGDFKAPKGATLWMSQWLLHRDPRYFDAPLEFRPERWAEELMKRIPRYAYFPFGGGPRICIGDSFAKMEAVLLLATIAQSFKLMLAPGASVRPLPTITLRPDGGVPMVLVKR